MHAFLLSLIGLGSSKCLFWGNVSDSYITGVRARLDYILLGRTVTSAIEVTKGFPSFTETYRLPYLVSCFRRSIARISLVNYCFALEIGNHHVAQCAQMSF